MYEVYFYFVHRQSIGSVNQDYLPIFTQNSVCVYTCLLILDLKKTNELFKETDRRVKDIQRKIYKLQRSISKNFGPDYEFAALDEQCYEIADQKYVYKLCLFEKVSNKMYCFRF